MPSPTGTLPMTVMQGGIEAVRGTVIPATRKQPILGGWIQEMYERVKTVEQRGSYIRNYRSVQVQRHVELSGVSVQMTYEDIPWFFQLFLKGGVTGVTDAGTPPGFLYSYSPTVAADDLKTATFEVGDDTANFAVPFCLGNRMQLGFSTDGPMTASLDFLGQRAILQAKTPAMVDRVTEDIIGSSGIVYLDDTTIGTTAALYPLSMNLTLDNGWQQLWTLGGSRYPTSAYRGETRMMAMEMQVAFDTTAEWTKFIGTTGPGVQRKIRYSVDGTQLHSTPTVANKNMTIDWYGYWDEASFGDQNGLRTLTLRGESHYDVTAAADWLITVKNGLTVLP